VGRVRIATITVKVADVNCVCYGSWSLYGSITDLLVLDDLMKDAQQERAEVRKELSMPNPHEALHNLALGLDGLQKWFEWFDDVVAPHLSEVGDARVSP